MLKQIFRGLFFSFFLLPSAFALETPTSSVQTYDELLHAIRATQHATEQRIEAAVDQEKVREAWHIGDLIQHHILLNKERADYGAKVVLRLSEDLEMSYSELKQMRAFARAYPTGSPGSQLSWAHYKVLLSVNDDTKRKEIATEAEKNKWSRDTLQEEIKKRKLAPAEESIALPESKPGKIGVYRVVEVDGEKYYDLGFETLLEIKDEAPKQTNPSIDDLYTYSAKVTQVVDGDTFHARIDLGFGIVMNQRVRLRRVDAPEIETSEGKEAKAYLEKLLARGKNQVLIKTFGEDQHGRPLVEVWVGDKLVEQELLDKGLATRMEE